MLETIKVSKKLLESPIYINEGTTNAAGLWENTGINDVSKLYILYDMGERLCLGIDSRNSSAIGWVDKDDIIKERDIFIINFVGVTVQTYNGEEIEIEEAKVESVYEFEKGTSIRIKTPIEFPRGIAKIILNKHGYTDIKQQNKEIRYTTYRNLKQTDKFMQDKADHYEFIYTFFSSKGDK